MITRQDYLEGKATHRQYYAQFVNGQTKIRLLAGISRERLLASTNENLNDIPLTEWDNLPTIFFEYDKKMSDAGDYLTTSGKVCIYKEAARQIIEGA